MNTLDFIEKFIKKAFEPNFETYVDKIKFKDFIYHYTSQFKLNEMLDRKEIWLSHALDMNDPGEMFFGIDIVIDILTRKLEKDSVVLKNVIEENKKLHKFNRFIDVNPVFVLSFSEKEDDLKQWVHYSNNGSGISFEFIQSKIIETTIRDNSGLSPILLPVQYYYQSKKPINNESIHFENFVVSLFMSMDNMLTSNKIEIDINFQRLIFDYVIFCACFIKHNLYYEEKEWRLIIFTGIGNKKIKTKIIDDIAQMKLILSLSERSISNLLNSIMIGPKNFDNVTNRAALELLMKEKLNGNMIQINHSSGKIK